MTFSLFPEHLFRIQISVLTAEADPRPSISLNKEITKEKQDSG